MTSPRDFLLGKGKKTAVVSSEPHVDSTDLRHTTDPRNLRAVKTVAKFQGVANGDIGGRVIESASIMDAEAELSNIIAQYGYRGVPHRPEQQLGAAGAAQVKKSRGF